MISGTLAKRYARALETLARSSAQRDAFLKNLEDFTRAAENADGKLLRALSAAHYPLSARQIIAVNIGAKVGFDPLVTKFMALLVARGRIHGIAQITRQYRDIVDLAANRQRASVRSAKALSSDAILRIKVALEKATNKQIILETSVDPDLIGGLVARVGSYTLDRSVKNSLDKLRGSLMGSERQEQT